MRNQCISLSEIKIHIDNPSFWGSGRYISKQLDECISFNAEIQAIYIFSVKNGGLIIIPIFLLYRKHIDPSLKSIIRIIEYSGLSPALNYTDVREVDFTIFNNFFRFHNSAKLIIFSENQCQYAVIRFHRRGNFAPIIMQSYQHRKPCLLGFINVRSRAILLPFG